MPHASRFAVVLLALAAVLASLFVASPASAAGTGSLAGVVQGKSAGGAAAPLPGAGVHLYRSATPDWSSELAASTRTAADGAWTVSDLEDGYYFVRVLGPDDSLAEEYWDDAWSPYDVTPVRVTGGAVVLPRPIVLETPGWVQGRVVDQAGQPIAGAQVSFRRSQNAGGYGLRTGADGRYDSRTGEYTGALLPGTSFVRVSRFSDDLADPVYEESETQVTVTAGAGATHDVTLVERPAVVLTVLDENGAPLADAPLGLQVRDAGYLNGAWGPIRSGPHQTDATGRYLFGDNFDEVKVFVGLPEGYAGAAVAEWWDDAYSFADARSLTFPAEVAMRREITVRLGAAPGAVQPATPVVSGVARSGRTLTAVPGSWGPAGVALTYAWSAGGAPVGTGRTLKVTNALAGKAVVLTVRGELGGASTVRSSAPTARVRGVLNSARPKVTGKAQVGRMLRAKAGTWGPGRVTVRLTWFRNGTKVKKATGTTYRLTRKDRGKRISVRATGSRQYFGTVTTRSAKTGKVAR